MKRAVMGIVSALLFLCLCSSAEATSMLVWPTRITLDEQSRTTALRVINEGDDKINAQVEAFSWRQDENGYDIYEPTEDLVFFPKILTIDKGSEKVIRVGYEGKGEEVEKTFRLYIRDLPVSKPGETAIKISIKMGIPVFIKPVKEVRQSGIESLDFSQGVLKVRIGNSGNSHIFVTRVNASGFDVDEKEVFSRDAKGWYLLSGVKRTFMVPVTATECLTAREIRVQVEVDKGFIDGKLQLDDSMCAYGTEPLPGAGGERTGNEVNRAP